MTNNPEKIHALVNADIIVTRLPMVSCVRADTVGYLQTKVDKMGHMIPSEFLDTLKKSRA